MKKFYQLVKFPFILLSLTSLVLAFLINQIHLNYPLSISFPYYQTDLTPYYSRFWATLAHFDGIHYLRLANHGYSDWGSQAFFPLYPLLISLFSKFIPPLFAGLTISLCSLLFALVGLQKLFPERPSLLYLVLAFPTAFFFFTLYTESLFFAISIWFFVALKHKQYLDSAILAGLASSTRLVGVFLGLALILELWPQKYSAIKKISLTILSFIGLISYMGYLFMTTKDPLLFFHVQPIFGGGRSGGELILLPQVIYRYLKMFVTIDPTSFLFQRALIEFTFFVTAFVSYFSHFKKLDKAVSLYLLCSLLLPTLSGSLSSFPRYLLVLTPWILPTRLNAILFYLPLSLYLAYFLLQKFALGIFVS